MTLKSVMLQLEVEQIELLDREASRVGASRSQLVRDVVAAALRPHMDDDLAERYRLAYGSGANVDEWGDLDEWHASAARDRLRHDRDEW